MNRICFQLSYSYLLSISVVDALADVISRPEAWPSQYETEFSREIDIGISSPQSIDVAPEDRALGMQLERRGDLAFGWQGRF